jgi:hypothetical protein
MSLQQDISSIGHNFIEHPANSHDNNTTTGVADYVVIKREEETIECDGDDDESVKDIAGFGENRLR